MTDGLIAVNKRMILNQRKTQTGNLEQKLWLEIDTTKALQRLGEASFQQAKIPDTSGTPALPNKIAVKFEHFGQV